MKKNLITVFFSFFLIFGVTDLYSQSKKIGKVYKKDGTIITGNVRRFYNKPTFERVDPLIRFKSMFNHNAENFFFSSGPISVKEIKVKQEGVKKFEKIPIEEVDAILISQKGRKGEDKTTLFKTFVGDNFYGKKKKKPLKLALPVLTEGKGINTYGTIYPIRKLLSVHLFIFEVGTPTAFGFFSIENKEKNLVLDKTYIDKEKMYSKKRAERRSKSTKNLNHNSLEELFGDCPETKELIDKYYIKRIEDKDERKQAAIAYNKKAKKAVRKFKDAIRKDRTKATPDLYFELFEFDLLEIIRTYEKNCLPIDEFDPRHQEYKKQFDLLLNAKRDSI